MGFAELCSCWNKVLPCWMEQERVRRKQSGHVGQVSFGGSKSDEFIAFPYSILSCSLSLQSLGSLQSKQDVPYPNPPPQEQVSKVLASKYPQKNLVLQHAICYSYANLRGNHHFFFGAAFTGRTVLASSSFTTPPSALFTCPTDF